MLPHCLNFPSEAFARLASPGKRLLTFRKINAICFALICALLLTEPVVEAVS